jgi:hypothetical protein
MNSHKKLRELGFKKTNFYKPGSHPDTYESMMVLDNEDTKWEYRDGKRVSVKVEKIHPKSSSFWILKYSDNYILWCLVKNHFIDKIWLENKSGKSLGNRRILYYGRNIEDERLKLIFDISNRDHNPLEGKNQIMNILPKEIKRDFLLDQIFNI